MNRKNRGAGRDCLVSKKTRQREIFIYNQSTFVGCLAQLARASALHAEGQGFKSLNIHHRLVVCKLPIFMGGFLIKYLQIWILLL